MNIRKSLIIFTLSCFITSFSNAEIIKNFGNNRLTKEDSTDITRLNKCEKQKKCKSYIDMINYKEAKLVVEMPESFFNSFKNKTGIQSLYWGMMMIAKENAPSALQEFTNNKKIYINTINSGLNTPQSRIFIRINIHRIENMNTIIIKDKEKVLDTYTFSEDK